MHLKLVFLVMAAAATVATLVFANKLLNSRPPIFMQMKRLYCVMRNEASSAGPTCSPRSSTYHYAQLPACIVWETKRDALRSGNIRFSFVFFFIGLYSALSFSVVLLFFHSWSLPSFLLIPLSLLLSLYSLTVSPFITSSLPFIPSLIRYPFSLSLPFFSRFTSCFYLSLLLVSFLSLHFFFYLSFHSFITFDLFPTFLCIFYLHPFFVSFYILLSI